MVRGDAAGYHPEPIAERLWRESDPDELRERVGLRDAQAAVDLAKHPADQRRSAAADRVDQGKSGSRLCSGGDHRWGKPHASSNLVFGTTIGSLCGILTAQQPR